MRHNQGWLVPSVPAESNVLRLGEVAFVTAPLEYYLDFGDRGMAGIVRTLAGQYQLVSD